MYVREPRRKEEMWSVSSLLNWATADLKKRGDESARLDAELMLGMTLELDRVQLILQHERPLSEGELYRFKQLFMRRRSGEPMAYILGRREFYGFDLRVDARVLIPRPDTETLVEVALERTRGRDMYGRALDLCTGSGCVALALGITRRTWRVTGVDLSKEALSLARENALRLGSAHNVHFVRGDLFAPLAPGARYELIVANPPYIPSADIAGLSRDIRDFEPRLALDGGPDGYALLRRLIEGARNHLVKGGVFACEVGAGQSPEVQELLERADFKDIERTKDYGGHERVVSGVAL